MNKERLLNVAKALRESPDPEKFNMGLYSHACGTPACAWGHYCARGDLQSAFKLSGSYTVTRAEGFDAGLSSGEMQHHLDIRNHEVIDLFFPGGCGGAETAIEAAEYIEDFVRREGKS